MLTRLLSIFRNATAPPRPNHCESRTIAHQTAMLKALAMFGWQPRWYNADGCSQAFYAPPVPLYGGKFPRIPPAIQGTTGASALPAPSPSNNEPEGESGLAEHGVAAQLFTPNLNATSQQPSLLRQQSTRKSGRKSPWLRPLSRPQNP